MSKLSKKNLVFLMLVIFLTVPLQAFAAGVVLPDMTQLADRGSAQSPALWYLNQDIVTPDSSNFIIGGSGKNYNQLAIDENYSFTASNGLLVGPENSYHNLLDIQEGGHVTVLGTLGVGKSSISYFSRYNRVRVSGSGALLTVNGNLWVGKYLHSIDNTLELSNGGMAVVEGDFSLYHHWCYGNAWLELGGGALFLSGDRTTDFAEDKGILSSIKVWDEASGEYQRVAKYADQQLVTTPYLDLLAVDYIQDSAEAASLGFPDDYVGYTVVYNTSPVPIPGTVLLLGSGLIGLIPLGRKRKASS